VDHLELKLHPKLTVLVGRNNSGKSRLLRAIGVAVGALAADRDDLTLGGPNQAAIDVILAPSGAPGAGDDRFDARLANALGSGARQTISEQPLRERAGWRTIIKRSSEGLSAVATRRLLRWNATIADWELANAEPTREFLKLVWGDLIETRRDLALELRARGSAANRLLDDLELDAKVIAELQQQLDDLSVAIVAGSATLQRIQTALEELSTRVDAVGRPRVLPVPGRVNDLSTVAAIEIGDNSGMDLPLRLHGSGARSLASLQLQGVLYERRLGADAGNLRPHALTLIEEPEAHLHPQAQFDLRHLLESISGQVIASTHSTHLVSELDHAQLAVLIPRAGSVSVVTLIPVEDPDSNTPRQLRPELYVSEMEKLRRGVERPFGEILFACAIVVGDGAMERALLPELLRHALGSQSHGLCVVDPGSMGDPAAVSALKAARLLGIPWFIFGDSDVDGQAAVQALLSNLAPAAEHAQLRTDHVVEVGGGAATEAMLVSFDDDMCRDAAKKTRPDIDASDPLVAMKKLKGSAGRYLARELIAKYPDHLAWPAPLVSLINLVRAALVAAPDRTLEGHDGLGASTQ
jgi:putative ATP-dependent endonuclease of the OLD family